MLNEWSDRVPPERPRRFDRRGAFWLGVSTVGVCGGLLLGMFARLLG
jgi:hypothetical protein